MSTIKEEKIIVYSTRVISALVLLFFIHALTKGVEELYIINDLVTLSGVLYIIKIIFTKSYSKELEVYYTTLLKYTDNLGYFISDQGSNLYDLLTDSDKETSSTYEVIENDNLKVEKELIDQYNDTDTDTNEGVAS